MSEFNQNIFKSNGSYVVVKRTAKVGPRTLEGKVVFENSRKGFNIDDIVIYNEDDSCYIQIDKESYEIILYYRIILKKEIESEKDSSNQDIESSLKFDGTSGDF